MVLKTKPTLVGAIDPYASGVLDPEVHDALVADIERFAEDANITPDWIWRPISESCGPGVQQWIRRFRFHAPEHTAGLLIVGGQPHPPIEDQMAGIAGSLTRNFIRARVTTLNQLIDAVQEGVVPAMSCLLVPNFFAAGSSLPDWRIALLLDGLLHRNAQGLQTVLYAAEFEAMSQAYGSTLVQHLEAHYQRVEV
jgi:hypothetical protein